MGCTKTDFIRGMQCPRMLWLDKHHPELKQIPDAVQERLDNGNSFGDKAMGMFGPFEEMTAYFPNTQRPDKKKMVRNTLHHLDIGTENICEAAFDWNGNYCAVDILHKSGDGYEMYEVKNSGSVSETFIRDAGYQSYILRKCGINLLSVNIVYYSGDEEDPFEIEDITEEASAFAAVVDENLPRLCEVKDSRVEPDVIPGEQCSYPYECWYCAHCGK